MQERRAPPHRGLLHLGILLAVAALSALYLHRQSTPPGLLDPSGRFRLVTAQEKIRVERASDGAVLASGEGADALAAWDPKRSQCLVWTPFHGCPGGRFWGWREGAQKPTELRITARDIELTPDLAEGVVRRQPRLRSDGRPDWAFSPDGLRAFAVMLAAPGDEEGLLVCLHPWQLDFPEPRSPLLDGQARPHVLLDRVRSAQWKSDTTLAIETVSGPVEVYCQIGPSEEMTGADDTTPELSADGDLGFFIDKSSLRVMHQRSFGPIAWQLNAKPGHWNVMPRWHSSLPLLAVSETTANSGTRVHVFTMEKSTDFDLGDLGGEGPLRAPVPSPDGRRVLVMTAPVFGNYDVQCGKAVCCHLADHKVHEIVADPRNYRGPDPEIIQRDLPGYRAVLYGTRRADWTSPSGLA